MHVNVWSQTPSRLPMTRLTPTRNKINFFFFFFFLCSLVFAPIHLFFIQISHIKPILHNSCLSRFQPSSLIPPSLLALSFPSPSFNLLTLSWKSYVLYYHHYSSLLLFSFPYFTTTLLLLSLSLPPFSSSFLIFRRTGYVTAGEDQKREWRRR